VTRRALLLAGLGAFIGGRLHFVAIHLTCSRTSRGTCCAFWLHAGGAIVGAVVALAIAPPRTGVPAWRLADAIVPIVGVGIAVARLGLHSARLLLRHWVRLSVVHHLQADSYVYQLHASLAGFFPRGRPAALPSIPCSSTSRGPGSW